MPLNDHEQKILEEIERRLSRKIRGSSSRSVAPTSTRTPGSG